VKIVIDSEELTNLIKIAIKDEMNKIGLGAFSGPLITRIDETIKYVANKSPDVRPKKTENYEQKVKQLELQLMEYKRKIMELEQLINNAKLQDTARLIKENQELKEKNRELTAKVQRLIQSLRAREEEINRLYNLTEDDPRYQPYYVLRDEAPNWVSYVHISNLTGIPISRVKKILKEFEMRGLVEMRENEARCLQMIRRTR